MCDPKSLVYSFPSLSVLGKQFTRLGFSLPDIEVERIERVRTRLNNEKDYWSYSHEKLLEALSFPGGRWRRDVRSSIELAYRSKYIDMLLRDFPDRRSIYGSDDSDSPSAYAGAMELHADPNFLIYSRLSVIKEAVGLKYAFESDAQIDIEVAHFSDTLDDLLGASKGSISKLSADLFAAAAQRAEISHKISKNHPRVVLETNLSEGCSLYLDWDDEVALRKWGRLQIAYSIAAPNQLLNPRSSVFRCSLESFLPGGNWYARANGSTYRLALAVFVHVEYMRLLAAGIRLVR